MAKTGKGGDGPLTPDLCVIGAGSAGLSVAAIAASLGASVVLIEKGRMGGECLNAGCVPSKALLAAARRAHDIRTAGRLGIAALEPDIEFADVQRHVRAVVAGIAPMDSAERYRAMGVTVIAAGLGLRMPTRSLPGMLGSRRAAS
jgi:pyruvate/2-oxoglutarate dehydrogenase complex dihydrolipoamide dehydrogenase (E3) component